MRGIGYGHPEFGHGYWKGESVTGGERLAAAGRHAAWPASTSTCRRCATPRSPCPTAPSSTGIGILEQLAIGPHPSGLTGILDGYAT